MRTFLSENIVRFVPVDKIRELIPKDSIVEQLLLVVLLIVIIWLFNKSFRLFLKRAEKHGFDRAATPLVSDLVKYTTYAIGLLLGALIAAFVPDDFFLFLHEYSLLCMLVVLLLAMPMYTCATGSIPLALALVEKGITPIICVGESLEQREMDLTIEYITYQVKAALSGITGELVTHCVIAYEPIWAIGTGRTATAEQAEEVCRAIREAIKRFYDARTARKVSILYGGSMNAKNAAELLAQPDIDGGLIGGASLKPADFAEIVKATIQG